MTFTSKLSWCHPRRSAVPEIWSKIVIWTYLTCIWGDLLEFRLNFWHQKTRVPGLSYGVICMILGLAILVKHRQTDTRWRQQHLRLIGQHYILLGFRLFLTGEISSAAISFGKCVTHLVVFSICYHPRVTLNLPPVCLLFWMLWFLAFGLPL